jgi:D-alanine-D-alanine ligase
VPLPVRIGLAYNVKPEAPATPGVSLDSPAADEPHSRALRPDLPQPDLYIEWDDPSTIDAVERALSGVGEVIRLEANQEFPQRLLDYRPDFVFNIAEGIFGPNRESHVPAICEFFGVPYHASDPLTLSLCLHKGRAKEVMQRYGVPTAPFRLARSTADARSTRLPFPLFAKPAFEGSGKGVTVKSLCHNRAELVTQVDYLLSTYREPVLIETYLPGREFTVAILGNGEEARCLPIVGMCFDTLPDGAPPIYGYEAKWVWDTPARPLEIFECPAQIPETLAEQIREAALDAYQALDCRDWCRVDLRCDAAGRPMVVELNPLPGILPDPRDNSCFPKAAAAAGMSYDELIRTVADIAWRRISGRSLLAEVAS